MNEIKIIHVYEHSRLQSDHFTQEAVTAAYVAGLAALRAKLAAQQIWHDAVTEPPPQNGLYYGAKDDTNSMWAVRFKDGTWTLSAYPDNIMQITRWAYWGAFSPDEPEQNDPLTLEELWGMDGEPVWVTPLGFWALVIATPGNRIKLICNDGETVWADKEIELVGPVYRRPPEE